MKSYAITVNGKTYDVTVEEKGGSSAAAAAAPAAAPAPAPAAPAASGSAGSVQIKAGAAGKIFKVSASVGDQVTKGQEVIVMEVMKMETPVVAPQDGRIASIEVSEGQNVESGVLLATME